MLLNTGQIKAIDSQSIWLEISADDVDRSTPNPQLYPNPTGLYNARLNQLCLTKVGAWLSEQEISHHSSFNETEFSTIWDVVTGCAIEIGKLRLILIPTENLDRDELRVPQEWLDLPNWAGDYYLGVQIDLESNLLNIWGFAAHQALKDRGRYSEGDRTYSLDSDSLVHNLDLLWIAEELDLAPRNIVPELPTLSLDRALELIKIVSTPSPYSPRLALDFAEWGTLLDNSTLRSELNRTRLQRAAIAQAPAPTFSLVGWLNREFDRGISILPKSGYFGYAQHKYANGWQPSQSIGVMSPNHQYNNTIERAKLIDLQINLQREIVVLLVGIIPETAERMRIIVRVHPTIESRYLPPQLQLSYVDPDGISLRTVTARTNDDYIQLPAYTCAVGMEFNIQLQLHTARSIERFVV